MPTFTFTELELKDAHVLYCPDLFAENHKDFFDKLNAEINWESFPVKVFDKVFAQPRDSSYIADDNRPYLYSGFDRIPSPWTPTLTHLRNILQETLNEIDPKHPKINAVLCNRYLTGKNYIGPHSDNEGDLHKNSYIISVSFGVVRDFVYIHKSTGEKLSLPLASGSVILMGKNCQKNYKHTLPKRLRINEPRINLTFRCILERD